MPEYRQLIDDIQSFLSSELMPDSQAVRPLHSQYSKAVFIVNRRLRECDELLQKGHRAQAIQMAESEPKLLELVAQLDFPQRDEWAAVLKRFGLPVPPALLIDVASDLNEAYVPKAPLDRFLRLNRLHALAYSPLKTRIQVLRKIAELDSRNPIWDGDVRTFEKARHVQIQTELQVAVRTRDVGTAVTLADELHNPKWRETPSPKLKERAASSLREINRELAAQQLQSIEADLQDAWRASDLDRARELRTAWKQTATEVTRDRPDAEVSAAIRPVLQWLAREDQHLAEQFEEAVQSLQTALLNGNSQAEIEEAYQAVLRFQRDVPVELEKLIAKRLGKAQRSKAHQAFRKIAGILGTMSMFALATSANW